MPLILLLLLLQLTAPLQLIEIIFANSRLWGCCGTIFCGFLSSLRDDRFRRLARATSGLRPRNRQLSWLGVKYSTKYCVLLVEFWKTVVSEKELAAISVRSTVSEGKHSSTIMLKTLNELIFKRFAIDTFALFACTRRISTLNDESYIQLYLPLILRWNIVLSYFPLAANAKKFLQALGHNSQKSSILIFPCVVCNVRDMIYYKQKLYFFSQIHNNYVAAILLYLMLL